MDKNSVKLTKKNFFFVYQVDKFESQGYHVNLKKDYLPRGKAEYLGLPYEIFQRNNNNNIKILISKNK